MFKKLVTGRKETGRRGSSTSRSSWDREVLHGTLRSELDEPARLPAQFARLVEQVGNLRSDYETGLLTKSQVAERLSSMQVTDNDGAEWTLGMTTGQWHRRYSGGAWLPALPPEASDNDVELLEVATQGSHDRAARDALDAYLASGVDHGDAQPAAPAAEGAGHWAAAGDVGPFGPRPSPEPTPAFIPAVELVDPVVPYPEVSADASTSGLPDTITSDRVVADTGGWSTTWTSVVRSETDDLEAMFAHTAVEPDSQLVEVADLIDSWPDNASGLTTLFDADTVDTPVPSSGSAGMAAWSATPGLTSTARETVPDITSPAPTAEAPAAVTATWADGNVLVGPSPTEKVRFSGGLVAAARDEALLEDPVLANLLRQASEEGKTSSSASTDFGTDLPPELFGN